MFERYTEGARRIVFFARHEASQAGSPLIETEHLLLGVQRQARRLITSLFGREVADNLRNEIEERAGPPIIVSAAVDLPLSNSCNRVFAYAAEEAERAGEKNIDEIHILLGLVREEHGVAAEIFHAHDVTMEFAREALKAVPGKFQFYCPRCVRGVASPLTCGKCSATICRVCGTPLESSNRAALG
ncbi:MAG TPA: Clp protease N-terminal domain-containing protein [Terriglobales bacterium]|jgi:ATP-dependent Clp protease ATP-binding subunit ClpC|nr:Clp protease N-terminal domain-containing protein [Terriglobales bacterium]